MPAQEQAQHTASDHTQPQIPPLPQPLPTLPDLPNPPADLPSENTSLETFKQQLQEAIKTNAGVIKNTHYTLQGIAELLNISADLWKFYKYHATSIKLSSDQYQLLHTALSQISTFINHATQNLDQKYQANTTLATQTHTQLQEAKTLSAQTTAELQTIQEALTHTRELQALIQTFNQQKDTLQALTQEATQIATQLESKKQDLTNHAESKKAELTQSAESKKQEFTAHAKALEQNLAQQIAQALQAMQVALQQAAGNINQALQQAAQHIQGIETKLQDFNAHAEAKRQEFTQALAQATETHKADLESKKNELADQLALQALKNANLADIELGIQL